MAMTFDKLIDEGFQVDVLFISREYDWSSLFNPDLFKQLQSLGDVAHFLHAPTPTEPKGDFYNIDEWWPEQADDYCRWVFSNNGYEMIFCNYIFMSRVFELCDRSAAKILDTHDLFADRHKLLAANGLSAEFFYTDKRNEGTGLDRANVAIAIKDEEADYFRRISDPRVITLPYVEDVAIEERLTDDEPGDGPVKFGFFGSHNSINVKNIVEFVRYLESKAPPGGYPFEFWLYGSLCRRLKGPMPSYVKLGGFVRTTAEFYHGVDCVVNPQYFSTGLKIKIAEALAFGAPLISHRHSFEGFGAPLDAAHDCADFDAVLSAMMDVVADRSRLRELGQASRDVQDRQTRECERQWGRILKGSLFRQNWLYFIVNVECFNRVRFYRHIVELAFATFSKSFMICMVADTDDDTDSLWRLFKRKANRFGHALDPGEVVDKATWLVFDDPAAWASLTAGRDRVVIFDDAARMVADLSRRPPPDLSGVDCERWVVVRSDRAAGAPRHRGHDLPVNYFRWLPWDMSVVATGDQYDLAAEVWVLRDEGVGPGWLAQAKAAFPRHRIRYFGDGDVADLDGTAGAAFDLMGVVFAQKMIPELVLSFSLDDGFAPMKAWFTANGIALREYAPYVAETALEPNVALGLPRLSEFSCLPDRAAPVETVTGAWVGSGWRRFTNMLTEWAMPGAVGAPAPLPVAPI